MVSRADIERILEVAIRAPSAHNAQPWRVQFKDGTLLIFLEESRLLSCGDANNRQAFISVGCFVQAIVSAANSFGHVAVVERIGETAHPFLVARITFEDRTNSHNPEDSLLESLQSRTTNRNPYKNTLIPEDFISNYCTSFDLALQVTVATESEERKKLADVIVQAAIEAMDDPLFRAELADHVKSNITHERTGIPAYGMGIPTPVSLVVPFLLRYFNMSRLSRKQDEKIWKHHTPAIVVLSSKENTSREWIEIGSTYMRIALAAEKAGIRTAPQAAPIQIGEHYKRIQEILHTDYRPQFLFRMGYTMSYVRPSPRLRVDEILE